MTDSPDMVTWLGSLVWFTISSGESSTLPPTREELEGWFSELDLDTQWLPAKITAVGAFKNAASAMNSEYKNSGWATTITAKDTERTTSEIVKRKILRTQRHPRDPRIHVDKIGTLTFYRPRRVATGRLHGTESWKFELAPDLPDIDRRHAEQAIAAFSKRYDELARYYEPDDMRKAVREYVLSALNAVSVRPGVYFSHDKYKREIDAVATLVSRFGPHCSFHQLPLIDTDTQRHMLIAAIDDEMEAQVSDLLREVNAAMARYEERRVPPAKVTEMRDRYLRLVERCNEHADLLELVPDRTAGALNSARDAVLALFEKTRR